MAEALAVRIRHRLRHVESFHDRRLFVECLEVLESPGFVPKIPHPDGSGDPQTETGGFTGEAVISWMTAQDIKLFPWQLKRLEGL